MFTKKVPNGNAEGKLFCINRDARNLEMLPRNPPVPISSNVLIINAEIPKIAVIKFYHNTHKVHSKVTQRNRLL